MSRKAVWIFLTLLTATLLMTIPAQASERGRIDDGVQRSYTAGSGLQSTAATSIAQTSDGFLWIGGYGGLVRYDGRTFTPCLEGEMAGVLALLPGDDGALWIATNDLGLIYYQNDTFTQLSRLEGNALYAVSCLTQLADGTVCFGTEDGIGTVDADLHEQMENIPEIEGEFIICIEPVSADRMLCVTRGGELVEIAGQEDRRIDLGEDTRNVRSVRYDAQEDRFLVGTQEERFLLLDSDLQVQGRVETPGLECINEIMTGEDGVVWLCSDSGVGSWVNGRLYLQSLDMDNSIDHMMRDREGSYWFTSSRQGVLEVSPCRFGDVSRSAGMSELVVNAIVVQGNRMFIGHDEGLKIIDMKRYMSVGDPAFSEVSRVRIRSILDDGAGGLWFFTKGKGALHYDSAEDGTAYSSAEYPVIASDVFRCGTLLEDGTVLAGTDIGAYLLSEDGVEAAVDEAERFDHRVLSVYGTRDHYWLGTDGYGLYEVQEKRVVRKLASEDGLGSNVIMKIVPGRAEGGLWLVLGNGLARMEEDGSVRRISSVPSRNVLDFILLEDGDVWLPAGTGIFRTTEQALLADEGAELTSYRQSDGLPHEITANSNQCISGDMLYLCGTGGITSLNLTDNEEQSTDYPIELDAVHLDGERIYVGNVDAVTLTADVRRVDVDAHVLTYKMVDPYVFYYLEGFDSERTVQPLSAFSGITYTNLNKGSYTLHFGLTDPSGEETRSELLLALIKEPHWYERWDVRILLLLGCAAALVGAGLFYVQRRVRREQRLMREQYEKEEKAHLHEIAYRDYLTGLFTRNYISEWVEKILPQLGWPVCFATIDCNNLKKINDRYGHKQGDLLLQKCSMLLKAEFREEDSTVFRIGGDEFLVLTGGVAQAEMNARLNRVRAAAAKEMVAGIPLSFCAGVCEMDREHFDLERGMRLSDMEMLKEKDVFHKRAENK